MVESERITVEIEIRRYKFWGAAVEWRGPYILFPTRDRAVEWGRETYGEQFAIFESDVVEIADGRSLPEIHRERLVELIGAVACR